jgi:hypothetical protein
MTKNQTIPHPVIIEDDVVDITAAFLASEGWNVTSSCHGTKQGIDIDAERNYRRLVIEAKGSIAKIPSAKIPWFTQHRTTQSLVAAIDKAACAMYTDPNASRAIAIPDNPFYRKAITPRRPSMSNNDIRIIWVTKDGATWDA